MAGAQRASDRGDSQVRGAGEALLRGALDQVRLSLRIGAGADPGVRAHGIAALPGIDAALERWRSASPDDPDLHLILAIRRLDSLPWIAVELEQQRTQEQQWYDEVESLWRAVEHLQVTLADDPDRAVAQTWMAALMGALAWRDAMPKEDFEVCADAAQTLSDSIQLPRWRIHLAGMQKDSSPSVGLAEQLAGSWGNGDPRHAEVATAHVDRYRVLLDENRETAPAYWLRDDVHAGLVAANTRFGSGTPSPGSIDASNVFAFTLARTREPRLAVTHFDRIGGRLLTWPWAMLRQPLLAHGELETRARGRSAILGRFRR